MRAQSSFDFATIRVVPRVDRAEFVNAGVILFCFGRRYLGARVCLNEARLKALWCDIDLEPIRRHLDAFPLICNGETNAGPIARLSQRERFHWMLAPRSTVIQISPVHSGLCEDPEETLRELFGKLVE